MAFPREVDAGRDASSARYSAPFSLSSLNSLYLLVKTTTRRRRPLESLRHLITTQRRWQGMCTTEGQNSWGS